VVANLGLILFLLTVGMEVDTSVLLAHGKGAGLIAFFGMAIPFALGVAISGTLLRTLQGDEVQYEHVSFTSFFVFIGTALSVTAFPVLARILKERKLVTTKPGIITMGAAAMNDAGAWCLLILAIAMANSGRSMEVAAYVFLCVCAFAAFLFVAVGPALRCLVVSLERSQQGWRDALRESLFALALVLCFVCAWVTAFLGVHAIFGAFLFGMILPRGTVLYNDCLNRIEHLIVTLTLPLYFGLSGLSTDVTQLHRPIDGAMVVLVCVAASVGKYVGTGVPALVSGLSLRESAAVAALMNTRGLIELIVLNLGREAGILSTRTFTVMVLMCLFTTFITCPCIELVYPASVRGAANHHDAGLTRDLPQLQLQQSSCVRANHGFNRDMTDVGVERKSVDGDDECAEFESSPPTLLLCIVVESRNSTQALLSWFSSYDARRNWPHCYCINIRKVMIIERGLSEEALSTIGLKFPQEIIVFQSHGEEFRVDEWTEISTNAASLSKFNRRPRHAPGLASLTSELLAIAPEARVYGVAAAAEESLVKGFSNQSVAVVILDMMLPCTMGKD
jgi:Kef-type K+ transport system membrane component KefB